MSALTYAFEMDTQIIYQFLVWLGMTHNRMCVADADWHFLGQNVALNKPVSQMPGTYREHIPYPANLAVDGDNSTDFSTGSCSHTSKGNISGSASLTVDLGRKFNITGIVIFNRQDYRERLQNFVVLGDSVVIYNDTGIQAYNNKTIRIEVDGSNSYSSITVQIPGHTGNPDGGYAFLTLCEVQVYASPRACPPVRPCARKGLHAGIYGNSGKLVNNTNTVGTVIWFSCKMGYHMKGSFSIECLDTGYYNTSIPICIPDGCDEGYEVDDSLTQRICFDTTSFIGNESECMKIQCPYPVKLRNGYYLFPNGSTYYSNETNYDTVVYAAYDIAYLVGGDVERGCRSDCIRNEEFTFCRKVTLCDHPGDFSNGSYVFAKDTNPYVNGTQAYSVGINAKCDKGYVLNSTSKKRECLKTGLWSGENPVCIPVTCKWPLHLDGGYYISSQNSVSMGLPLGSNITAYCNGSFRLAKQYTTRSCNESGIWENVPEICIPETEDSGNKVFFYFIGVASSSVILLVGVTTIIIFKVSCLKLNTRSDEDHYTDLHEHLGEHRDYDQLCNLGMSETADRVLGGHINEEIYNDVNEAARESVCKEVVELGNEEEVMNDLQVPPDGVYFIPENEHEDHRYCDTSLEDQSCQSTV
ncbi:CUB and sushi domain-containing protein 3-like [Mercenaria mercenaria]|uniref:CUB and sushi domain-containing protein 3-like n=1 Tax=Mercenaria mercenaria TaxID=6596 RepID=UPI00234F5B84|nr:CUB and sushi domain-containing protein 3-like [Mercenaria mercenaria]